MVKSKSRKYTICAPAHMSEKLEKAYYALVDIDCNFSRFLQCLLGSIIKTAKYILKRKKNFRHYLWHIVIQDRETNKYYSTHPIKECEITEE